MHNVLLFTWQHFVPMIEIIKQALTRMLDLRDASCTARDRDHDGCFPASLAHRMPLMHCSRNDRVATPLLLHFHCNRRMTLERWQTRWSRGDCIARRAKPNPLWATSEIHHTCKNCNLNSIEFLSATNRLLLVFMDVYVKLGCGHRSRDVSVCFCHSRYVQSINLNYWARSQWPLPSLRSAHLSL